MDADVAGIGQVGLLAGDLLLNRFQSAGFQDRIAQVEVAHALDGNGDAVVVQRHADASDGDRGNRRRGNRGGGNRGRRRD